MHKTSQILLTGVTGFIGQALIHRLAQQDCIIYCLIRSHHKNNPIIAKFPQINWILIDHFELPELQQKLMGIEIDTVVNLAAYGVSQTARDHQLLFAGNTGILINLLLAVQNIFIKKFIHIGTCSEYAPIQAGKLINENHPLQPQSFYGIVKAAASQYGQSLAQQVQIPFTTLRLFNVYGPGEAPERLLPYTIQQLKNNSTVELTGGEQLRDWLYIDDAIDAVLCAINHDRLCEQSAYNICTSQPHSIRDLVTIAVKLLDKDGPLLQWGKKPYRADETMWLIGDNTRFKQSTGWEPKNSINTGIQKTIWIKNE